VHQEQRDTYDQESPADGFAQTIVAMFTSIIVMDQYVQNRVKHAANHLCVPLNILLQSQDEAH
jgi:hypothetical protein